MMDLRMFRAADDFTWLFELILSFGKNLAIIPNTKSGYFLNMKTNKTMAQSPSFRLIARLLPRFTLSHADFQYPKEGSPPSQAVCDLFLYFVIY